MSYELVEHTPWCDEFGDRLATIAIADDRQKLVDHCTKNNLRLSPDGKAPIPHNWEKWHEIRPSQIQIVQ